MRTPDRRPLPISLGAITATSRRSAWWNLRFSLAVCLLAGVWQPVAAQPPGELSSFDRDLAENCYECHGSSSPDGGLDLTSLPRQLKTPANFATWKRIYERIASREMPPADSEPMPEAVFTRVTGILENGLKRQHASDKGTVLRRLNRREYENTLNDLFGTNLRLADTLPEDSRASDFDNIGAALTLSQVQLAEYLSAIDRVVDASVVKTIKPPKVTTIQANYADTREGEVHIGKSWKQLDDGAVVFYYGGVYPTGMLRTAVARQAGYYRIKITGYAYQSDTPVTFSVGATTFQRGVAKPTFQYREFSPGKPTTIELTAWFEERYMLEITPWGLEGGYSNSKKAGLDAYAGRGLAILGVEMEGPLQDAFPSRGHRLVFDGLNRSEILPANKQQRTKSWYVPKFKIDESDSAIEQAIRRVAQAAFRQGSDNLNVAPFMELYRNTVRQGASSEEALRTAVAAVFCSPEFLFLREPAGVLDDYALATRLSYFLTRTTPDEALLADAASGKLAANTARLAHHVDRFIADPRFDRFIGDFTDAWLNLREIEFTNPDDKLFPEFDRFLQFSMLDETRRFVRQLFDENLPAQSLIRPDFAMLNSRLARHYGIEGVKGPAIRPVKLLEGSVRGGLLGQAAIHKVSSNGTNTSPVVRGVWVNQRILGKVSPPPPPGISGVEPDVRGAQTLREILAKHRDSDSCRSCHKVIDPPGFALESFNPVGGWRDNFRSLGAGKKVNTRVNDRRVRYKLGPPVDASGELADGREFGGFREFRDLLSQNESALAEAFATKLLAFSTGREMGFSDRAEIQRIVGQTAKDGYRIRDLVHAVVASSIFRTK